MTTMMLVTTEESRQHKEKRTGSLEVPSNSQDANNNNSTVIQRY